MNKITITLIFLLILFSLFEVFFALFNGQPECIFANDTITCVKIGGINE